MSLSGSMYLAQAIANGRPYDTAEKRETLLFLLAESVEHLLCLAEDQAEREATPPSAGGSEARLTFPVSGDNPYAPRVMTTSANATPPSAAPVDDERAVEVARAALRDLNYEADEDYAIMGTVIGALRDAGLLAPTLPPAPVQGEAAVEALARVTGVIAAHWLLPDSMLCNCGHRLTGAHAAHAAEHVMEALASRRRGAIPGYGPTGASDGAPGCDDCTDEAPCIEHLNDGHTGEITVSRAALADAIIYHYGQNGRGQCRHGCDVRLGSSLAEHAIDVALGGTR